MGVLDTPFIVGQVPARDGPLARFLPPLEEGIAADWLPPHASTGGWLLDPFGSAPRLAVEAARRGYRVLVTANNPVTRFLLDLAARPPTESELKAALADLAITKKGDERLEVHLQSLYLTQCANCGQQIHARAFLWKKGDEAPYARLYECPACGDRGERPATPADAERAKKFSETAGLHHARLLERVAPPDDPDREYAEEALAVYSPRAIYALATLINRLDAPGVTSERRRVLSALVLSACDAANNLWRVDNERRRPKQLTVSNEFRENNLWAALESSIAEWASDAAPVPFVQWPNKLPESGGVLLFEGRIAAMAALVKDAPIAAVVGALPRPNQAFWTLCALWAGWLWGHESAEPFHQVLRRRRYDWAWHTEALQSAMRHLLEVLALGVPFLGLVPEPEPAFLTAALAAAEINGFELKSLAMRTQHDAVQLTWVRGDRLHHLQERADVNALRSQMRSFLAARGEPVTYLPLHAAGLAALLESHALIRPDQPADEMLRVSSAAIEDALRGDDSLTRYRAGESVETGLWGSNDLSRHYEPLVDRVEMAIVNFLKDHPGCARLDLERDLSPRFPGLLMPSRELVLTVLTSYAEEKDGRWGLRPEDTPAARNADIAQLADLIRSIGERLDYATNRLDARTLVWEAGEASAYVFYLKASAILGRAVEDSPYPRERTLIVIPGGRAGLLAYKRQRDPSLAAQLEGFRFVKFRTLRALAEMQLRSRISFDEQIRRDPIEQARGQMTMF
jgi:hypothetical protein